MEKLEFVLNEKSNKEKALILQRFFKTGKGEYGEGDVFLGISVPELRKIAKNFEHLGFLDLQKLIDSNVHEKRMISLFLLVDKYKKALKRNGEGRNIIEEIVEFYLKNAEKINNWDLVDLSAPNILGDYFFDKDKKILYEFACSDNLWKKRIAVLSCFGFIRKNKFEDAFRISEILLNDEHDLIHKAVGWMLREIGKRDLNEEEDFLKKHYKKMPRTMLRYSIEKMDKNKRDKYLKGEI